MKKKPQWIRKLGQLTNEVTDSAIDSSKKFLSKAGTYTGQLDEEYEISKTVKEVGENTKDVLLDVNDKYDILGTVY